MKNSNDEIIRAYKMLKSLRQNIDKIPANIIEETYIHEYHSTLDKLNRIGRDVLEYYIPDSEITPIQNRIIVTGPGVKNNLGYSKEKYVKKQYLFTKMDALIGYLESLMSSEQKQIGFRKPGD